jgi:hypothetical protein
MNAGRPSSFGEEAMALDITIQLLIDLLVQANPAFGRELSAALHEVQAMEGPSTGTRTALARMKEHVDQVLADR